MPSVSRPLSILLVEDSADDERLALRAIHQCGGPFEVRVCRDGKEAMDFLFKGSEPELDLIFLDLKLPKVNGIEVLRQIRNSNLNPWLPVVMLSSSDEQRDILECYQANCSAYVRKAVNYAEYMDCMKTTLDFWVHVNRTPTPSGNLDMVKRC